MCLLIYHLEPQLSSNAVQTTLANTHMKVQLNFQLSQGSAATNLRGGAKFYSTFMCGSYRNTTVKELLKSIHICQSYPKNITCTFFMAHGVVERLYNQEVLLSVVLVGWLIGSFVR